MSPVFRRDSEYTFKIYSNEEERMHIHVLCDGHEAKYWLEPQVELAKNTGIPNQIYPSTVPHDYVGSAQYSGSVTD